MLDSHLIYDVQVFYTLRAVDVPYGTRFSHVQNFVILHILRVNTKGYDSIEAISL